MYKKKLAMETSNDHEESVESIETDPLAGPEQEPPALQNGDSPQKKKRGRKPNPEGKKPRKKSGIIKVVRKKFKKDGENAPGPDENGEFEVEGIVDHKKEKGRTLYRVRWKGYPPSQDSWLPGAELSCKDILKRYKKKIERENKDVYTVEKIIDDRRLHGKVYYRIRWEGYGPKDDTWQTKENLNCKALLDEYTEKKNSEILAREETKLKAQAHAKKNNNEWEVESIVDTKMYKGKLKYRVRWRGFDESEDTWEEEEHLNCPDLIRAFNKKKKGTPKKKVSPKKAGKKRKRGDTDDSEEEDDSDDEDYGTTSKRSRGEYEVERVINGRINKDGKWEFFVMWKGYGPDSNTWEPESNLNCPKLINNFLGKGKIPRKVQYELEKLSEKTETPKAKRKPPTERKAYTRSAKGLRGRTKGELKMHN